MKSSDYLSAVRQYLESDEWELQAKKLQEDTYLVRGKQGSNGNKKLAVIMILTDPSSEITPDHLSYLQNARLKMNADHMLITSKSDLRDEAKQAAQNNGIQTLSRSTVRSSVSDQSRSLNTNQSKIKNAIPSFITRRRVLTSGIVGGGLLAGGYTVQGFLQSDTEAIKSEAETIQQDELLSNIDQYIGSAVHYSPAKIAQVIETDTDTYQLRIQVTQSGDVWEDELLGQWEGERYSQNDLVELWGEVKGTIRYETQLSIERTIPTIDIVEMNTI